MLSATHACSSACRFVVRHTTTPPSILGLAALAIEFLSHVSVAHHRTQSRTRIVAALLCYILACVELCLHLFVSASTWLLVSICPFAAIPVFSFRILQPLVISLPRHHTCPCRQATLSPFGLPHLFRFRLCFRNLVFLPGLFRVGKRKHCVSFFQRRSCLLRARVGHFVCGSLCLLLPSLCAHPVCLSISLSAASSIHLLSRACFVAFLRSTLCGLFRCFGFVPVCSWHLFLHRQTMVNKPIHNGACSTNFFHS